MLSLYFAELHVAAGYWQKGEHIVVRHVWRGAVRYAASTIVVADGPERLIVFHPAGTEVRRSRIDFAAGVMHAVEPDVWHTTNVVRFYEPDMGYGISAMFWAASGAFACWYVDLQDPFRRTRDGIVTWDQSLDIVVAPDLSWRWKDEDHFARIEALGWITPEQARTIRRDGEAVIKRIEARSAPFNESWPDWRPDPSWAIPPLPQDWAKLPE